MVSKHFLEVKTALGILGSFEMGEKHWTLIIKALNNIELSLECYTEREIYNLRELSYITNYRNKYKILNL